MFVCQNIDHFVEVLPAHLLGIYGGQEEGVPGPFSLKSYLHYLLKPGAWGDSIVLFIVSVMWGLQVTVVNGQDLSRTKIRHSGGLQDSDVVLVHSANCHYIPAGEWNSVNVHE
jgi:hypothetical protein